MKNALLFSAALSAASLVQAEPFVSIDPGKVDADYAIQGEYTGKLAGKETGVQIVALGGGKFDAVLYSGGLPGAGWDGKKETLQRGSAETAAGKVALKLAGQTGEIGGGKLCLGADCLARTERKSPSLGAAAPAGAVILFDGSNTNAWTGNGMDEVTKLLKQGQTTKDKYGSYTLHLEFLTPYKPQARGQERGNSGLYNQGRYEVQVLDSFGLQGRDNECGGIYSIKAPSLNMCLPPLQWQTYDVDYTAAKFEGGKKTASARITVKHNGTVIHDNVELTHGTTAAPVAEGPEPGPLHLQDHGNPVRYRNIWLLPRTADAPAGGDKK